MLFSVHCVYFLWVRGYWSRVLQTLRSKEEGREVSRVGRKVARLTRQQWLVSSLLTLLLSQRFYVCLAWTLQNQVKSHKLHLHSQEACHSSVSFSFEHLNTTVICILLMTLAL